MNSFIIRSIRRVFVTAALLYVMLATTLLSGCFQENGEDNRKENDSFEVKRYNIRMRESLINERLEVGHINRFRVVLNSDESKPIENVPLNLYIVSDRTPDGSTPEQHFLGTYYVPEVNPGEHTYYITMDVPPLNAQTGQYTLTGHVCWGDEGEIFNETQGTDDQPDLNSVAARQYTTKEKDDLWDELTNEVKQSQTAADIDMNAMHQPDIEARYFSLVQQKDDPSTQPVFVVFREQEGGSDSPEESTLQQLAARLELYVHGVDVKDVTVRFRLCSEDNSVDNYLQVYDVNAKRFVDSIELAELRAYNKYSFDLTFKVGDTLYAEIIDHVKFFQDDYPFNVVAEVSSVNEAEKYHGNNGLSSPLIIVPAPDVIVPEGDELVVEKKWEKMFKKGKFGVGYSLGFRGQVAAKEVEDIDEVVIAASAEAWGQVPILLPLLCDEDKEDYLYAIDLRAYINTDRNAHKIDLGNNHAETYLKVFNKKVFGYSPPSDVFWPTGITPPEPATDSWASRFHKGETLYKWNREILSYSWPIPVGPVVIFAGLTVYAEFGFSVFIGNVFDFTVEAIPYFNAGLLAVGYVGYDRLDLEAGVACDVRLLSAYCRAAGWYHPHIQSRNDYLYLLSELGERIDVGVEGPQGEFYAFLRFPFLKFCKTRILGVSVKYPCGIKTVELKFSFCKWGPVYARTAELQKEVTALSTPLCPDPGIAR